MHPLNRRRVSAAALLLPLLWLSFAHATLITVTTTEDELTVNRTCSLREAVQAANTDQPVDQCPAGSPRRSDTIIIPAGTYPLSLGTLKITQGVTFKGAGASQTIIQGNGAQVLMESCVPSGNSTNVWHVRLQGGAVGHYCGQLHLFQIQLIGDTNPDLFFSGLSNGANAIVVSSLIAEHPGTGIANAGTMLVLDSVIRDNSGLGPGGIGNGGTGTLTLRHSTVAHNVGGETGGIGNSGTLNIQYSTVRDNDGGNQGGLHSDGGTVTIWSSTFSNNQGQDSGALLLENATGWIANSTISGNAGYVTGGLVTVGKSTANLYHTTITANEAEYIGGLTVGPDSTITLTHSLLAGNYADAECSGPFTSHGHNLTGQGTGCPSDGPGDLTVDPATVTTHVLGPLQDNGGPTLTHALLPGSPALDAGEAVCTWVDGALLRVDQRDFPRPVGAACDIGAVEGEQAAAAGNAAVAAALELAR